MKVRKRLWGAVLLLCALLCMVTVIVSADDSGIHTHPICGATHTDIGDHTEECADVVWTAWNGTDDIDYGERTLQRGATISRSRAEPSTFA